jgi:hypothetical protein
MEDKSRQPTLVPEDGEIRAPNENNIGTSSGGGQDKAEHIFVTDPLDGAALQILRGVGRYFRSLDCAVIAELPLADGRRCDLLALDPRGGITIVEIKSCTADFRTDQKWPDYRQWCDRFYFAVNVEFPQALIPADCGLILADRFGAEIMREAPGHPLSGARRKAVMLRFARCAAFRLQEAIDPELRPLL